MMAMPRLVAEKISVKAKAKRLTLAICTSELTHQKIGIE